MSVTGILRVVFLRSKFQVKPLSQLAAVHLFFSLRAVKSWHTLCFWHCGTDRFEREEWWNRSGVLRSASARCCCSPQGRPADRRCRTDRRNALQCGTFPANWARNSPHCWISAPLRAARRDRSRALPYIHKSLSGLICNLGDKFLETRRSIISIPHVSGVTCGIEMIIFFWGNFYIVTPIFIAWWLFWSQVRSRW